MATKRAGADGLYVQQFRFLRLSGELNYEIIALALKGLQVSLRPGNFLPPAQYETSTRHRRAFEKLCQWGAAPEPICRADIDSFLRHVHDGLRSERRGKPAHGAAYIAWSLSQMRSMLRQFNDKVAQAAEAPQSRP